jgi:deazaflavin-dependent oxidoreductase (nitroreductase family)
MPAPRLGTPLRIAWRLHRWVLAVSGGRLGRQVQGIPVLRLTTRGRWSGEPRTVALYHLTADDTWVVVGSNAGGDRDPGWLLNLRAEPTGRVRIGRTEVPVTAREATGDEREHLWRRLVALNSDYAEYAGRTARRIPVVVLEPDRVVTPTQGLPARPSSRL